MLATLGRMTKKIKKEEDEKEYEITIKKYVKADKILTEEEKRC